MGDLNPTPSAPPSDPEPTKRSAGERGEINQTWLDEISATEKLAVVAAKAEYAAKLAQRKIAASFPGKLTGDLENARGLISKAIGKSTGKKVVTASEKTVRDALIAQIQSVQSAAKQKYFSKNKPALADYYFAKNIKGLGRSPLETCASNILAKATADSLPGIEEAELKALSDAFEAYKGIETDQSAEQSGATTARKQLEQVVKEIADQRRELQFAADGVWPASKKENAGIRREFGLSPKAAFKG